ncbi:hypothetical protein CC1G_08188 [Coprinopsis cinerea okayama7|uniref:Uncharacterized protein n=1 Tax=Coprinopsis cinerea (strain Okayama-7 / 130 / ATCC MYA-4618 / FGSC 9003) TaxID=240176 RepID=A8P7A7_COPC7|nr:hypothetical protein CC1G_08188 [Coprinopsis cinerea okayama7\|eukprot:XP_001839321.1 hypothetical protein CC1G_08188 [Coprinopsis cinerea okayama7\
MCGMANALPPSECHGHLWVVTGVRIRLDCVVVLRLHLVTPGANTYASGTWSYSPSLGTAPYQPRDVATAVGIYSTAPRVAPSLANQPNHGSNPHRRSQSVTSEGSSGGSTPLSSNAGSRPATPASDSGYSSASQSTSRSNSQLATSLPIPAASQSKEQEQSPATIVAPTTASAPHGPLADTSIVCDSSGEVQYFTSDNWEAAMAIEKKRKEEMRLQRKLKKEEQKRLAKEKAEQKQLEKERKEKEPKAQGKKRQRAMEKENDSDPAPKKRRSGKKAFPAPIPAYPLPEVLVSGSNAMVAAPAMSPPDLAHALQVATPASLDAAAPTTTGFSQPAPASRTTIASVVPPHAEDWTTPSTPTPPPPTASLDADSGRATPLDSIPAAVNINDDERDATEQPSNPATTTYQLEDEFNNPDTSTVDLSGDGLFIALGNMFGA